MDGKSGGEPDGGLVDLGRRAGSTFRAAALKDAQRNPEKYPDLVRVTGDCAHFNGLGSPLLGDIIQRANFEGL